MATGTGTSPAQTRRRDRPHARTTPAPDHRRAMADLGQVAVRAKPLALYRAGGGAHGRRRAASRADTGQVAGRPRRRRRPRARGHSAAGALSRLRLGLRGQRGGPLLRGSGPVAHEIRYRSVRDGQTNSPWTGRTTTAPPAGRPAASSSRPTTSTASGQARADRRPAVGAGRTARCPHPDSGLEDRSQAGRLRRQPVPGQRRHGHRLAGRSPGPGRRCDHPRRRCPGRGVFHPPGPAAVRTRSGPRTAARRHGASGWHKGPTSAAWPCGDRAARAPAPGGRSPPTRPRTGQRCPCVGNTAGRTTPSPRDPTGARVSQGLRTQAGARVLGPAVPARSPSPHPTWQTAPGPGTSCTRSAGEGPPCGPTVRDP